MKQLTAVALIYLLVWQLSDWRYAVFNSELVLADQQFELAKKSDDKALKNEVIKLHKLLSSGARPSMAWAM